MTQLKLQDLLRYSIAGVAALGLAACASTETETTTVAETAVAPAAAGYAASWPELAGPKDASGFDPAVISALEARMAQFVADGEAKGISTLLVKDGKVVSAMKAGTRNLSGDPITDDTIYRIYSMTKPITGVAMMKLWEEGKWKLDDPVTKYVPEFANLRVLSSTEAGATDTVAAKRAPTMREIMSHTAGFAYGLGGADHANDQFRTQGVLGSPDLPTFIDKVADIPLLYQPGEAWFYSAAVDVQGHIIEKLTGMSLGEYLDQAVFTPLAMDDTGFFVPEADYDRFGEVFSYYEPVKKLVAVPGDSYAFKQSTIAMESGGGGLVSTISDYARFCQMLLDGGELGGVRILAPETVKLMRTDVLPEGAVMFSDGTNATARDNGQGFGLDFGIVMDPSKGDIPYGEGSYYWGGAAGTWFWIDPVNDLYFIGMIQRFGAPPTFRSESAKLVYAATETPAVGE